MAATRPHPLLTLLLPGAGWRDRLAASAGAIVGIALTGLVSALALKSWASVPVIVAPMGASAVLIFAVPSSPLAQPWPVFGGNTISALIGITAAKMFGDPIVAGGVAVGGAILCMSILRCLHPPGGAAALTAVIGGPVVLAAGYSFAFLPIALNSALMLAGAWLFHRLSGHSFPHRALHPAGPAPLHREDIDRALAEAGEAFDISRDDLEALLQLAEAHAISRQATARRR